jgi:hypothetical protein
MIQFGKPFVASLLQALDRRGLALTSDPRWERPRLNCRTWALMSLLVLAFPCHGAGEPLVRSINVTYDGTTYVTDAVLFAPAPVAVAWDVLTDFEHQPGWVPNLTDSKVVKRDANSVVVQQSGTAALGPLSVPYVTERKIDMEKPVLITATQLKGSLKRVASTIKISPDPNGTVLTYHIEVVPNFLAATVMSTPFFEHEIPEQFGAIVEEMKRRSKQAARAPSPDAAKAQ